MTGEKSDYAHLDPPFLMLLATSKKSNVVVEIGFIFHTDKTTKTGVRIFQTQNCCLGAGCWLPVCDPNWDPELESQFPLQIAEFSVRLCP